MINFFGPFNRTQEVHFNVLLSSWFILIRIFLVLRRGHQTLEYSLSGLKTISSFLWCVKIGHILQLCFPIQSLTPFFLDENSSPFQ